MGNEESTVSDQSTRPSVLEARSMEAVAKYIKQNDVKRIVLMVCQISPHSELDVCLMQC
jgi:NAD-dependent histone deacetylase SIR2